MIVRAAHRVRWTAVWVLLAAWFLGLMLGVGGAGLNLLLGLALAVLVYELLAVDPPA
jgi:uncharacterized membrane protein SpoIIM required for sporulation